jgi:addiction module HigA family antidote
MEKDLDLILPGEILLEEFLQPLGISQNKLSRDLDIPVSRVNAVIRGKRSITLDLALRLAKYFKNSPEFWLNLQNHYDVEKVERDQKFQAILSNIRECEFYRKSGV